MRRTLKENAHGIPMWGQLPEGPPLVHLEPKERTPGHSHARIDHWSLTSGPRLAVVPLAAKPQAVAGWMGNDYGFHWFRR